ncbi:agmatinase [Sinorhizobium medicae]|uniref:Agmatinase n=2 Tax=Sinorhizobium medicae TaxID=110321 RepID=A0ABX4T9W5_9HYPH|nr:agmatinase [Sinorhizobium medicae]ABR59715.1 putative agmatinase [Sinorhizobium medicae WSM419]MBO1939766.1 agmatinase [Sinorhizobium medicae]MBO1962927.1 agmatinase [Sinorhizobium medicae]MDX0407402.1 agmatinase [Sinorhizobium medicae]MDX0413545.1 agmatinase [Sinorhizobium medicae]
MANKSIDHAITATSLTSAASDPTHAGILSFMRRKYTKNLKGVDAVVWGVPFDAATSNRPGARFGPQAIRRASAIFDNDPQYPFQRDLFSQMATIDYGDCLLDYGNHQKTPQTIEREAMKILKSGAYLLTLGGDHYVTYPILKAHAAQHGPLALVQFDAHQDTWPDEKGRIDHGSFVGRAAREGLIDIERSIQIGIRTHAPEDCGIRIVHGYELEEMRAEEIAQAIIRHVGSRPAYLTFDIDCLDPAFAPGTGTPVAGGPSSAKILSVLRKLGALHITGSDVVEVAPAYDHADLTAIAGSTIAMYMLGLRAGWLAERRG